MWVAENLLKNPASLLVCLDSWDGGGEFGASFMSGVEVIVPFIPLVEAQSIFSISSRK